MSDGGRYGPSATTSPAAHLGPSRHLRRLISQLDERVGAFLIYSTNPLGTRVHGADACRVAGRTLPRATAPRPRRLWPPWAYMARFAAAGIQATVRTEMMAQTTNPQIPPPHAQDRKGPIGTASAQRSIGGPEESNRDSRVQDADESDAPIPSRSARARRRKGRQSSLKHSFASCLSQRHLSQVFDLLQISQHSW